MRCPIPLLCALATALSFSRAASADPSGDSVREDASMLAAMTFNIRYHNLGDGRNAWPLRRDWVAEIIRERKTDLACLQEALPGQIADLQQRLPDYGWYGVGRDDGEQAGEHTPIFYRKARFERLDAGAFWLSETPEQPGSKSWDAAITRVAVWLKLKDRESGGTFFVVNTHFDHRGTEARRESARLLLRRIPDIAGKAPVVLAGDFNCTPEAEPYQTLTAEGDAAFRLRDAISISQTDPQGPSGTWNGFRRIVPGERIDYLFVTPEFRVLQHTTIDETREGRFPSDHLPVMAKIQLEAKSGA
jgi:endonuclease/exonuclease/phosphatase family metal-dependent hydrolase